MTDLYRDSYAHYLLEEPMTLQDDLRAENLEVADTSILLTQAADRIDELEAELAAGDPARIVQLEESLDQITTIIGGVR